jgi:hypothetical protein
MPTQATTKLAIIGALLGALAVGGCGGGGGGPKGQAPPASPPGEFGHNVVRITGHSPADAAAAAVLAAYPPKQGRQPGGWVLVPSGDWRSAVLGAQFGAGPVAGGILPVSHDFIPTGTQDAMTRLSPLGFPRSHGIEALLLGSAGRDVLRGLSELKLSPTQLDAPTPAALSLKLVPYRGGFARGYSSQVLVVSQQERDYVLPAAAWSAYTGDTIAFVDRDTVPAPTRTLLVQRKKLRAERPTIYLVGPPSVISTAVERGLRQYGPVKRIAGPTAVETAIAFARYRDPATGFGWGLKKGPASVSLVNTRNWGNAVGAFDFAATGPKAPLLLTTESGKLPPQVTSYVRELRGPKANQGFVFGDSGSIDSAVLRELDGALAAAP